MIWTALYLFFVSICTYAQVRPSQKVSQAELQWVICEPSEKTLFSKLSRDVGESLDRDVYYSETANLDLFDHGAILRTRVSEKKNKTVAKIKDISSSDIPWGFLKGKDYKCEIDSYSGQEKIGCSLNFEPSDEGALYSHEQEYFLRRQLQFHQFHLLQVIGPAKSREWEWLDSELEETIVVESVRVAQKFFSLEVSVRVPISKKNVIANHVRKWLRKNSIQLCPEQVGKTEKLLRVLARPMSSQ